MIALRSFGWVPLVGVTVAAALGTAYVQRAEHRMTRHADHRAAHHADQASPGCRHLPDTVTVSLANPVEVGDLIAWASGFTCQVIVFDPRIVATGRTIDVLAPQPMTPEQAVEMFHAALATLGLAAVPDGNIIRIVEAAAIAPAPSAPRAGGM